MNTIFNIIKLTLLAAIFSPCSSMGDNAVNFGAIADCQYCNQASSGIRKYALSKQKLSTCVDHLNTQDLEFVIHLGDFIDRDFKSFDELLPIYNKLKSPHYQVLGNHDFDVSDKLKKDVPSKMGMPAKYYYFKKHNWRFIILDGNDVSFHAYPKGSEQYKEAGIYYATNKIKSPKWNGAIGAPQISWIESLLKEAQSHNEKVILFCHFPIFPQNLHNLWNSAEVIKLLEKYSCVKAYINGHNHTGNYGLKNGIHYLTLKGMVDTDETSYATIKLDQQNIEVQGFGREINRTLPLRK